MNDIFKFTHHLKDCPFDFLRESTFWESENGIDTNALLLDVLRKIDSGLIEKANIRSIKEYRELSKEHLKALHIAAWFFSLDFFCEKKELIPLIDSFLFEELALLSKYVKPEEWLSDEDRTEEFARTALMACNIIPETESTDEAIDRLDALSILKRNNILSKSKAAFDRVIEIRKQMAEKKAREAANVYGRE